ncbi:MAG: hypothetical protein ACLR56_07520 [Oscillospiraceae bacterium]
MKILSLECTAACVRCDNRGRRVIASSFVNVKLPTRKPFAYGRGAFAAARLGLPISTE